MPEEKPIPFLLWILLNFVAWLLFWTFIEPIGVWLLYRGISFDVAIHRILRNIGWLPMGIFMLAYNCFCPLSFYSWIFYSLLFISYFAYRLAWKKRKNVRKIRPMSDEKCT